MEKFFIWDKFSKNLDSLKPGDSINCPLFLSTSIDKRETVLFLHHIGGVFFKIKMKKNDKVYFIGSRHAYNSEKKVLLPPNCRLIITKLKYVSNQNIDKTRMRYGGSQLSGYALNNQVLMIECDFQEPDIIYDLNNIEVYRRPGYVLGNNNFVPTPSTKKGKKKSKSTKKTQCNYCGGNHSSKKCQLVCIRCKLRHIGMKVKATDIPTCLSDPNQILVLSYNILNLSFDGDTKFKRPIKLNNIKNFINNRNPDILCLQEASHLVPDTTIGQEIHYKDIQSEIPTFTLDNITFFANKYNRAGDSSEQYGTLTYWNPDKFEKVSEIKLSISASGLDPIIPYRPCVGTKLLHKNTGSFYIVINVHLGHHVTEEILQLGINTILQELKYVNTDKVLLMGDFNEFNNSFTNLTLSLNITPPTNKSTKQILKLRVKSVNKQGKKLETCCGDVSNIDYKGKNDGKYTLATDMIMSNFHFESVREIITKNSKFVGDNEFSNASDHYPLLGSFNVSAEPHGLGAAASGNDTYSTAASGNDAYSATTSGATFPLPEDFYYNSQYNDAGGGMKGGYYHNKLSKKIKELRELKQVKLNQIKKLKLEYY